MPRYPATRPVLITTSVLFHAPIGATYDRDIDAELNDALDALTKKLGQAIAEVVQGDESIEAMGSYQFNYLDQEGENARPCSECGMWLTDDSLPNPRDGLMGGYKVGKEFLCDQDFEMRVESGLILLPEGYWRGREPDEKE